MTAETITAIEEKFSGPHDCGPKSLLRVIPDLDPEKVWEAFVLSCKNWPYGGVSNREFAIATRFLSENGDLNLKREYRHETETLADLLGRNPSRCVALLDGHFIAILDGEIVGREPRTEPYEKTEVVCSWTFS